MKFKLIPLLVRLIHQPKPTEWPLSVIITEEYKAEQIAKNERLSAIAKRLKFAIAKPPERG